MSKYNKLDEEGSTSAMNKIEESSYEDSKSKFNYF